MLVNSFGATCGVFFLCVLLLVVDTEAVSGFCVCLRHYKPSTTKPQDPEGFALWEANAKSFCRSPLINKCTANCQCVCPLVGFDACGVDDNGASVVICNDGSNGVPQCGGENDRAGLFCKV